jgi:fatty-acyl-CoA synthase
MGGTVVLHDNSRKFDADGLWELVARENVSDILIVGDAFAKPMLDSLNAAQARGAPFDTSSLKMIGSSGVMFSSDVKKSLLGHMNIIIFDGIGATEGSMGAAVTTRDTLDSDQTAHFNPNPTTKVLTEDGREVTPGSDEIGLICNGGAVPLGYYKDPEKSAKTFKTINGTRYSIPGDFARVLADGSIMLLGRGSVTINSGGEKIFPEEVEEALKSHAAVYDCLVVGVPDDRFGQKVVAVLSFAEGQNAAETELQDYLRDKIAGYKIPRLILTVPTVGRAANGKPDYKWASATALEMLGMTA